ncbi:MAG: hypothetical protein ACREEQ_00860, partial [Caulobacteraceae bacterium]
MTEPGPDDDRERLTPPPGDAAPPGQPPLMGNPVLRRTARRRTPLGWYVGLPIAFIVIAGLIAYFGTSRQHTNALMTNAANPP